MYLRFVTLEVDENSHKPQGILRAAGRLQDSGQLNKEESFRLQEIFDWFNQHLPHPPKTFDAARAIFWFLSSAKECVDQMWELVWLLRNHGCVVEVYKCRRLANIQYRDDFQVAAYPSDRDTKITVQ